MDRKNIIKMVTEDPGYGFLRTNPHLGNNIALLCLGGSYGYGTNTENSDVDIRGIALHSRRDILTGYDFEQKTDNSTDTVIYSLSKIITLMAACNPNTIELLGCRECDYLYLNEAGKMLLDNRNLFLSKKAVYSFGGYANQQLYRLTQKAKNTFNHGEMETHILKTMQHMQESFVEKYCHADSASGDGMELYIGESTQPEYETEIFMDVKLSHYPVRDYLGMWSEMQNMVHQYGKLGKRNKSAIEHQKMGKHMMHLVRLYHMCFDILENEKIVTYREKEHKMLMDIRNGKYIDKENRVLPEFFDMVRSLENRLQYAAENTSLPEIPDMEKINDLKAAINEKIVLGKWKEGKNGFNGSDKT